jgi:hypothetical protein
MYEIKRKATEPVLIQKNPWGWSILLSLGFLPQVLFPTFFPQELAVSAPVNRPRLILVIPEVMILNMLMRIIV